MHTEVNKGFSALFPFKSSRFFWKKDDIQGKIVYGGLEFNKSKGNRLAQRWNQNVAKNVKLDQKRTWIKLLSFPKIKLGEIYYYYYWLVLKLKSAKKLFDIEAFARELCNFFLREHQSIAEGDFMIFPCWFWCIKKWTIRIFCAAGHSSNSESGKVAKRRVHFGVELSISQLF